MANQTVSDLLGAIERIAPVIAENARAAEATFNQLRDMPGAPATFISVDVCEIVGHA